MTWQEVSGQKPRRRLLIAGKSVMIIHRMNGRWILVIMHGDALWRMTLVICPLLSGPEPMIVWTTKGTLNAEQEAQAGRDHRQAA